MIYKAKIIFNKDLSMNIDVDLTVNLDVAVGAFKELDDENKVKFFNELKQTYSLAELRLWSQPSPAELDPEFESMLDDAPDEPRAAVVEMNQENPD